MREDKVFKTLDEQVETIKNKGISVEDEEKAKQILLRENYFFILGYRHIFVEGDTGKYTSGVTFSELYSMFLFDRALRNIFFRWILVVENNFKSIMSYTLSKKYGYRDSEYLIPQNFTQDSMKQRQVRDVLKKVERQIRVNGSEHTATLHYKENYGYIPLWVIVKVLSFGIMSDYYSILKNEDRKEVAENYNLSPNTLEIYLSIVSNYRNICAHEEILYNHKTQKEVPNNCYFELLNIPIIDGEYQYGKNDLFSLVIILKSLLTQDEFKKMIDQIADEVTALSNKVKSVPTNQILNYCGFPENWEKIVNL